MVDFLINGWYVWCVATPQKTKTDEWKDTLSFVFVIVAFMALLIYVSNNPPSEEYFDEDWGTNVR